MDKELLIKHEELKKRERDLAGKLSNAQHRGESTLDLEDELLDIKKGINALRRSVDKPMSRRGKTAQELKDEVSARPKRTKYETGIPIIDANLDGGIELGTYVQIASESGVGKTTLVMDILTNVASYNDVVFFNFEMGDVRLVNRLDSLMLNQKQWSNFIVDSDTRSLYDLVNEIKFYAGIGVKFIAIDSMMKIETEDQDDYKKINRISHELAKAAQQNDIIIFLINQMSEEAIKTGRMAFKGSNSQQYDSDISLFYVKDKEGNRMLYCTKNRQNDKLFHGRVIRTEIVHEYIPMDSVV